jgi:hypothetical protein
MYIRNLVYNCCAISHSEEWLLNVKKLNTYSHVFNGRKLVIVRTGENIVEPNLVREAFDFDAEFIILPNNTELQEVSGFLETLGKLESLNPDERTFYAHTKGVRYAPTDAKIKAIRIWREAMYDGCLSDLPQVDKVLDTYSCCGCFLLKYPLARNKWLFAGSFWWVNHAKLFSHPSWKVTRNGKYSTEHYLSGLFPSRASFCLTGKNNRETHHYIRFGI